MLNAHFYAVNSTRIPPEISERAALIRESLFQTHLYHTTQATNVSWNLFYTLKPPFMYWFHGTEYLSPESKSLKVTEPTAKWKGKEGRKEIKTWESRPSTGFNYLSLLRHKLCIIFFSKTRKIQSRTIIFREPCNNLLTNITGSSHTEEYCPLVVFLWTLLHSVCTTSEGQPFPDFFQAGILWTLRYSFFFSLCYHVKRGLQMAVTVTVKASHTLSSAERERPVE